MLRAVVVSAVCIPLGCKSDRLVSPNSGISLTVKNLVVVPNPAAGDNFFRGIHYFTGWRTPDPDFGDPNLSNSDVPKQYPWDDIRYFTGTPPRKPALDFYDDGQSTVSDDQILAMVDAGYDYVIYQIGWSHKKWGATGTGLFRGHAVSNHTASQYASKLKFTVMWDDANSHFESETTGPSAAAVNYWNDLAWGGTTVVSDYAALFTLWFRDYASNPNFYFYGGRPVVFFFDPETLRTPSLVLGGSTPTAAGIISLLRSTAAQYGYSGASTPYVVGTNVPDSYVDSLAGWGFDAHSGYVYNTGPSSPTTTGSNFTNAESVYKTKWNWALSKSSATFQYWIPNASGSDSRPWGGPYRWSALRNQFESLVKSSKDTSAARSTITGRNLVTCCWNEWGEGIYIEPSTMDAGYTYKGSGLSDAHRRTVLNQTAGSNRIPEGWFDLITGDGYAQGWAVDPDTPNQRLIVHFYKGGYYPTGQFIAGAVTDSPRPDINSSYGIENTHGFSFKIPTSACNSYIYVHLIDTSGNDENPHLGGGPRYFAC